MGGLPRSSSTRNWLLGASNRTGCSTRSGISRGALAELRPCGFSDTTIRPATRLTIRVKRPETEHTVSVGRFTWLNGAAKSPSEQVLKVAGANCCDANVHYNLSSPELELNSFPGKDRPNVVIR
jgi:hypothetical protein